MFMAPFTTSTQAVTIRLPQYLKLSIALKTAPLSRPPVFPVAFAHPGDSLCEHFSSHTLSRTHNHQVLGDQQVGPLKSYLTLTHIAAPTLPIRAAAQVLVSLLHRFPLSQLLNQSLHGGGSPRSGRKASATHKGKPDKMNETYLMSREQPLTSSQARGRAENPFSSSSPGSALHGTMNTKAKKMAAAEADSSTDLVKRSRTFRFRTLTNQKDLLTQEPAPFDKANVVTLNPADFTTRRLQNIRAQHARSDCYYKNRLTRPTPGRVRAHIPLDSLGLSLKSLPVSRQNSPALFILL
ncbi:hypothetical protein FGO68_gene2984 [Halteria grandinella]|uniref:Uncharacterized protein n=1 Tax=Halteria grandinella TaxID=5974 RepID=A0A8J8NM13_HALGN|nr:hypothetical protein FGO68_gene2984 [Halteria grandinella]